MEKRIEYLRNKIYEYYESMLLGENKESLEICEDYFSPYVVERDGSIIFSDLEKNVFCVDDSNVDYDDLDIMTYVFGDVLDRKKTKTFEGIIISSKNNGIIPFEEYSLKDTRPGFRLPFHKGLIINIDSLNNNKNVHLLKGKSVDEVININFYYFDLMNEKCKEYKWKEYLEYYEKKCEEEPLFF